MNMNNAFKKLFTPIQAEEGLKERTLEFLAGKTKGYTERKAGKGWYGFCAAACACFLLVLFGGHRFYFTPVAAISIDINPSIEMSINRLGRVIFINGFNEDGWELSDSLDVKYKNYTDAIEQILHDDTIAALLSGNEIMTITVIGPDRQRSEEIFSEVEACAAHRSNTYCYFATSEETAPAHEAGLSCGKYRAFLELQHLDPDITPETVQGMTMREIRELIDRLSDGRGAGTSLYDYRENGHHGHGGGHRNGWKTGQ